MKETTIDQTLVLCDLDSLLLDAAGNLPQLQRDVLQLFASRGGRLTVFSQRSPRAVRSLLGGVRLSAPALVCGGTLAYNFSEGSGTALCSFEGMEESVLKMLPSLSGVGIALQMRDGSTRAVRMSEGLVFHLKQEWTPFVLSNAADVKGEDVLRILFYQDKKQMPILPTLQKALGDAAAFLHAERLAPDTLVLTPGLVSGSAMLNAVCPPSGYAAEQLTVLAGCTQMLDLVHLAGESVVPADAAPELRLAANRMTLTDHDAGAAAELLYGMVKSVFRLWSMNGRCVVCHLRRVETSGYKSVPAFRCRARISVPVRLQTSPLPSASWYRTASPTSGKWSCTASRPLQGPEPERRRYIPPLCRTVPARTPVRKERVARHKPVLQRI